MPDDFEEFTRVASQTPIASATKAVRPDRVAVLGGGPDARLLAALALSEQCEVTLFSAYGRELEQLRTSSGIRLQGDGPVGVYHVDQSSPSIKLTAELDVAVREAEFIFLTGPVHKQRTYAMVLADHLADNQILVLADARTFGAIESAMMLEVGGCSAAISIIEVQGLPFWYHAEGTSLTLTDAGKRAVSTLPKEKSGAVQSLSTIVPNLVPIDSILGTSFIDFSAGVEVPALIMGGPGLSSGGFKIPIGGVPLTENQTFAALIGYEQRQLITTLAQERKHVAAAYGIRDLPEVHEWISTYAGAKKGANARIVPDRNTAYTLLRDGVIGSLAPLCSAADLAGLEVPYSKALMTLVCGLLKSDISAAGRQLGILGSNVTNPTAVRRVVNDLLRRAT